MTASWIAADWPAPAWVHAGTSTRQGGISQTPYSSLNLALHVGDDARAVAENRARLGQLLHLPAEPSWLQQVHGNIIVEAGEKTSPQLADGSYSATCGSVCAVMTADCLPILLCDEQGTEVAALHAGWRGISAGIIEAGIKKMQAPANDLMVWLGPAISAAHYEVDQQVYHPMMTQRPWLEHAFVSTRNEHWQLNLYEAAKQDLQNFGVLNICGGQYCTFDHAALFYSHRRDGVGGRMASLIWLDG